MHSVGQKSPRQWGVTIETYCNKRLNIQWARGNESTPSDQSAERIQGCRLVLKVGGVLLRKVNTLLFSCPKCTGETSRPSSSSLWRRNARTSEKTRSRTRLARWRLCSTKSSDGMTSDFSWTRYWLRFHTKHNRHWEAIFIISSVKWRVWRNPEYSTFIYHLSPREKRFTVT